VGTVTSVRAKHAAIRKQLGCANNCAAIGPITHKPGCPAAGKWLDEAPASARSREASVPVGELEELVAGWRTLSELGAAIKTGSNAGFGFEGGTRRCADDLQALIDKVTP
jgi:hypothetical protein